MRSYKNQFIVLLIAIVLMIINESVAPKNTIEKCMDKIHGKTNWCNNFNDLQNHKKTSPHSSPKPKLSVKDCKEELDDLFLGNENGKVNYCKAFREGYLVSTRKLKQYSKLYIMYLIPQAKHCDVENPGNFCG